MLEPREAELLALYAPSPPSTAESCGAGNPLERFNREIGAAPTCASEK
jgi:hypothetical protein